MLDRKGEKKGEKKKILNKFLHKTNKMKHAFFFFMHHKVVYIILCTQPVTVSVLMVVTFQTSHITEPLKEKQC